MKKSTMETSTIYALSDLVRSAGPFVVLVIAIIIMGRPRS